MEFWFFSRPLFSNSNDFWYFFSNALIPPHVDLAFSSVEYLMRDVPNGLLIRYIHANGASMFFILVYSHICRGLYYGSYMEPRELLWCSGVLILFLMMGTAFTGYVLPWGQMSFWGATVITPAWLLLFQ